jgi:asparagine synthase (glutamine-hydrolysing)
MVMRRAMANILPEEVRWRGGKADMNSNFLHGILLFDRERLDEVILCNSADIEKYVNIRAIREVYQHLVSRRRVNIDDALIIWRVVTLAYWLLYSGLKP